VKTITITAFERPKYLAQVINSISANNVSGWSMYAGVDPCGKKEQVEIVSILKSIKFMPVHISINPKRIGPTKNGFQVVSRAFGSGSVLNIHMEEDVVLSPDATEMAEWFFRRPDQDRWDALSFLPHPNIGINDPSKPDVVYDLPLDWSMGAKGDTSYTSWGFCFTASVWRNLFCKWWTKGVVWDIGLRSGMRREGKARILGPAISRSNHIGFESSVQPSWNGVYRSTFGNHKIYTGARGLKYVIETKFI